MPKSVGALGANLLLASLPMKEQRRLLRCLETVTLERNESLYQLGQPIEYVHFPLKGCLISVVKVLDDGKTFDAVPVGYEGMVGVEVFLGANTQFGAIVRVSGGALRIRGNDLKAWARNSVGWTNVLGPYFQFLLVSFSQKAGCNCFHSVEEHFCSWLLTVQDRIGADVIPITHAVFAEMLGVRRVGITVAAQKLQQVGLIRYSWGKLTILDRQRLEAHACVCYQQHTQAYQRLLNPAWPKRRLDPSESIS
ncbi:MAG TPA: Crp/Fnr family transcriptional regulator [Gemmataceae bacterium]|nr:Crp/Fnr family transcriptional regulator [Gemmataceae bacterium]